MVQFSWVCVYVLTSTGAALLSDVLPINTVKPQQIETLNNINGRIDEVRGKPQRQHSSRMVEFAFVICWVFPAWFPGATHSLAFTFLSLCRVAHLGEFICNNSKLTDNWQTIHMPFPAD